MREGRGGGEGGRSLCVLAPSLTPILTAGGWEGSHSSERQIWSQADSGYEQALLGNYALCGPVGNLPLAC